MLAFLNRLGTIGGNDANISQLVFIFAPLLCRPLNSAYMSVRHMEDLRKLRPVLQLLVENYADIFRELTPPPTMLGGNGLISSQPLVVPNAFRLGSVAVSANSDNPITPKKKNLFVDIRHEREDASPPAGESATMDVNDVSFAQISPHSHKQINFQSKEWNVSRI